MKRFILAVVAVAGLITVAACGVPSQSAECKSYITCFEKTGGTAGAQNGSYGPSGTCWQSGATADSCTAGCKSALATLKMGNPDAGC